MGGGHGMLVIPFATGGPPTMPASAIPRCLARLVRAPSTIRLFTLPEGRSGARTRTSRRARDRATGYQHHRGNDEPSGENPFHSKRLTKNSWFVTPDFTIPPPLSPPPSASPPDAASKQGNHQHSPCSPFHHPATFLPKLMPTPAIAHSRATPPRRLGPRQQRHDRLLGMQPVLGLLENRLRMSLQHFFRDFLTSIRRQTMHDHHPRRGRPHQFRIDLVRF